MKKIDSDALGTLTKALGMTGRGSQITELEDGTVEQVLEIGQIARRGRSIAGSTGIWTCVLQTVAASALTLDAGIDPYEPGALSVNGYPASVPEQFDVWILGATFRVSSGTGLTNAVLRITMPLNQQGWGATDADVQQLQVTIHPLAFWDTLATITGIVTFGVLAGEQGFYKRIGLRIPRGATLDFATTSSAQATFNCEMIMGVFPISLGQDIAV